MRRNRKDNIKRERIIMLASSAFVLAALTMTGIYMKDENAQSKDDGYMIDFTELENNADNKFQEIAKNQPIEPMEPEDDLDYAPMEAGSHLVQIPGLTDGEGMLSDEEKLLAEAEDMGKSETEEKTDSDGEEDGADEAKDTVSGHTEVVKELHFPKDGLARPIAGEVLMPYSMESSIYFATLDQYKYNPAVMYAAEEGSKVSVCAEAKVVEIYEDAEIGKAVVLDLGDGYRATYGQLKDIAVKKDAYVNPGETIGVVAAPTKYFSVEGTNLYFQVTKNGESVNPEDLY